MLAANFASTISTSRTGAVRSSSSVPVLRSSATSRMVMTGSMSTKSMDIWKKMCRSVATLLRKRTLVNV